MGAQKQREPEGTPLKRISVEEADRILGVRYPVLDKGFIALMDYMGDDSAIVQAARVSYGEGTKSIRDDAGLIRYLLRHKHTTPFEMVELKFLVRMPIYVARQWVRHRTANINEYSARYSIVKDEFYIPELEDIQGQSDSNRQGRQEGKLSVEDKKRAREIFEMAGKQEYEWYKQLIDMGVAREMDRGVLGTMFYTEWYWKNDLHNIFNFLSLRLDPHAQLEVREYAARMAEIVKKVVPIAYSAFEDFALNSVSLSEKDRRAVSGLLRGKSLEEACDAAGLKLEKEDGTPLKSGEGPEFLQKLDAIRTTLRNLKENSD